MPGLENGVQEPALQLPIEHTDVAGHLNWATKSSAHSMDSHLVWASRKSWTQVCLWKASPRCHFPGRTQLLSRAGAGAELGGLQQPSARGEQWIQFPPPFVDFTISSHPITEGKNRLWSREQYPCRFLWLLLMTLSTRLQNYTPPHAPLLSPRTSDYCTPCCTAVQPHQGERKTFCSSTSK